MLQYYTLIPEYITTPNGGIKKVIGFRRRLDYKFYNEAKVQQSEMMRIDHLCDRIAGGVFEFGRIIDMNEKDIFSFSENEKIKVGFDS